MLYILAISLVLVGVHASGQVSSSLRLTTTAWPDGGVIPSRYTRAAQNPVSPGFKWAGAPPSTVSFVFWMRELEIVERGNDGLPQWIIWNVPAAAFGLAENMPEGDRLPSGSRQIGMTGAVYNGPDASSDGVERHYAFELFALDVMPQIEAGDLVQTHADLLQTMQGHIIGKAAWFGRFRPSPA